MRTLVAVVLGLALGVAPGPVSAEPTPATAGDGALHLPKGELASDVWTVAARFDTGHLLLLEVGVTNIGLGDRNGALIGHLVAPDGTTRAFRKARREGRWSLGAQGRRIEVGPLLFDRAADPPHLHLERDAFRVEIRLPASGAEAQSTAEAGAGTPATPVALGTPEQRIEVVHLGAPVQGTLWTEEDGERRVRGSLALVRRFTETVESRVAARRLEFFSLGGEGDPATAYGVEIAGGGDAPRRWLVVGEGDRVLWSGPVDSRLAWDDREAFALPEGLRFEAPHLETRVRLGPLLLRNEPLRELPLPVRLALAPFLEWKEAWSRASFEIRGHGRGEVQSFQRRGRGIVRVSYFEDYRPPRATGAASGAR